jgi:hypothetical protein
MICDADGPSQVFFCPIFLFLVAIPQTESHFTASTVPENIISMTRYCRWYFATNRTTLEMYFIFRDWPHMNAFFGLVWDSQSFPLLHLPFISSAVTDHILPSFTPVMTHSASSSMLFKGCSMCVLSV